MTQLRLSLALSLASLISLAACASTTKRVEWTPPEHEVRLLHYAGDPLTGPKPTAPTDQPDSPLALAVRIETYFLEVLPSAQLHPLSREATLHSTDGSNPIQIVSERSAQVRVGFGDEAYALRKLLQSGTAGQVQQLATYETVLPEDVTVALEVSVAAEVFATELVRSSEGVSAALVTQVADQTVAQREVSMLRTHPSNDGKPMAMLVPVGHSGHAFLYWVVLDSVPGDSEQYRERLAHCMEQVRAASSWVQQEQQPLEAGELEVRRITSAVDALEVVKYHRSALVFLASQSHSPLAQDVAWLASDEFLQACVQRVLGDLKSMDSAQGREQTAWRLELACYQELAEQFSSDKLPPELVSILFRHAGELGSFPGLLNDVLIEAKNQGELATRLISENKLFLEDRNPAARVRAFDWLETRGASPAGYDPLASRDERRAVLMMESDSQ